MKTRLFIFMIVLNVLFIRIEASNDTLDTSSLIFPEVCNLICEDFEDFNITSYLGSDLYVIFYFYNGESTANISEVAQPFEVNTPTPIKSIVTLGSWWPNSGEAFFSEVDTLSYYVRIWDSYLTNILYQARYDTLLGFQSINCTLRDIVFDSTIVVNGKFYVSVTSDTNVFLNVQSSVLFDSPYHFISLIQDSCTKSMKYDLPKIKLSGSNEWIYTNEVPFTPTTSLGRQHARNLLINMAALLVYPRIDTAYVVNVSNNAGIETDMEKDITIFPNPAKNILNIESTTQIKEIELINPLGQVLFKNNTINTYNYQLNLENYPTGTYLIKVLTNSGQATKKVIKE